jgi:GT2 family glycosyltransferase
LLSVVAPTCNRAGKLRDLLSSLGRQTYPRNRWELIVIDNNSRDDTAAVARSFPGARVAFYAERQSSYAARNHGVGVARGEVLAFIDDDCLADPDWLANGAQWFEHPAIGGVAGAVRAAADDSDIARWQARRGALALHPDVETSQFPAVPTANVFYRRAVFDQIGPFAEDMVSGGDYEFAWRMTAGGRWRFRADATAGVEHRHRQNLRALCRVYFRYGYGHVDLFRRHPQALQARDGDPRAAARAWARLARQAWRFAWQGVSPAAAPGLVPTAPADFARALGGREARAVVYASTRTEGTPVAAMLRAAGADVRALPLPPSLEFLETAMDAAAALGLSELYLYGAGQHTLRLARLRSFPSLQARGVIDDRATPGAALAGLPVVTLAEARRRGCRSILVSTDAFEHVLLPRLQPLTAEGVAVLGLYDDAALERYGRRVGGQSPVAAKTALLVSDMDLASARLAALARGLGATVRLDETAQSQYADDFLEWLSHLCLRAGRLAGSARFGRLIL